MFCHIFGNDFSHETWNIHKFVLTLDQCSSMLYYLSAYTAAIQEKALFFCDHVLDIFKKNVYHNLNFSGSVVAYQSSCEFQAKCVWIYFLIFRRGNPMHAIIWRLFTRYALWEMRDNSCVIIEIYSCKHWEARSQIAEKCSLTNELPDPLIKVYFPFL